MAAITLDEVRSKGLLKEKTRKLPPWAREYIEELQGLADETGELKRQADLEQDFDQALAGLWLTIAAVRDSAGDRPGADRAARAAFLMGAFGG